MTNANQMMKLADGNELPVAGFGTYKLDTQELMNDALKTAVDDGYQLIDTAQLYKNEDLLGQAFVDTGINRHDLFITTKVAEMAQGYDRTLETVEGSLKRMQTDYIDLLLVHWPVFDHFFETWRAFEQLKKDGKVRSIGVSNYSIAHLELLKTQASEMPVLNQIERHPYLSQQPMVQYDRDHDIVTQAWSPLGRGAVLDDPMLKKIAEHHDRSIAQIILRWHLQEGVAVIPKSKTPSRIKENLEIFDFELSDDEMTMIDLLNKYQRTGREPELVYEYGKQY